MENSNELATMVRRGVNVPRRSISLQCLISLFALLIGCSEERPLAPPAPSIQIYVGAMSHTASRPNRSVIFYYDFDSLNIVDSLELVETNVDLLALQDDMSLIVATAKDLHSRALWKYDRITKKLIWYRAIEEWVETTEAAGRLRLLDSGRCILFNRTLVGANDGQVFKTFPLDSVPFGGSESSSLIAMGLTPTGRFAPTSLEGYDIKGDTTWGHYDPKLASGQPLNAIYTAVLHPDRNRVLAIGLGRVLQDSWFVVGDLHTGETLFEWELSYPFGEILIPPDGSRAFVSDPSRPGIDDSYPTIDLINLDSLTHLARLTRSLKAPIRPGQIAWVPCKSEIVVAPTGALGAGAMATLDAYLLSPLEIFWLPNTSPQFEYITGGLAVGISTR